MNTHIEPLRAIGQSLWLDNITRAMLDDGTLARYIAELSITGLTSNPTIFEQAIGAGAFYDAQIADLVRQGKSGEELFFALALQDLKRAADLFRPIHRASDGVDGWASLEVSPLLADDTGRTIEAARRLHAAADRTNLYIKIPGTPAGIAAIEESIFAGVPINVTLLFSREHYRAAAEAYLRGIERRIAAGLDPKVESVASLFVSRWDVAANAKLAPDAAQSPRHRHRPPHLQGLPRAARRAALATARRRRSASAAAALGEHRRQGSGRSDTLYLEALAAPDTVNTVPEKTLKAFADHGEVAGAMPADGGDAETVIAELRAAGIDDDALAERLQREGAAAFAKSWQALMTGIAAKVAQLAPARP